MSHIKVGLTDIIVALKPLSDPDHVISISRNQTMYIWRDFSLQTKKNIVTHILRNPKKDELFVQQWLQKYPYSKFSKKIEKKLNGNFQSLIIDQINTKVIYQEDNGRVYRVVHYEI